MKKLTFVLVVVAMMVLGRGQASAAVDYSQAVRYAAECDGPAWDNYFDGYFAGNELTEELPAGLCGHRALVLGTAGDQCLERYPQAVQNYYTAVFEDNDYLNDWISQDHVSESCAWSLIAIGSSHNPGPPK